MKPVAAIALVTILALLIWDNNISRTLLRVLLLVLLIPLMVLAGLETREDPAALVDAWNEWRSDFARGHL